MDPIFPITAAIMLVLSFFFSGTEIAFITASRLKIELKTMQGSRAARILSEFKKRTSEVLITILIGNNLALVVFTLMMESLLAYPFTHGLGLDPTKDYLIITLLQTVISTLLILVLAEYIPKALFRSRPDIFLFPSAYFLQFFYWVFRIPVMFTNQLSRVLLRVLFRVPFKENPIAELDKKELDQYIQEIIAASEETPVPDLDTDMLTNAMEFKDIKARECMIPRTDIVALPMDATIEQVTTTLIETQLSKLIIFNENLDDVRGFIHSSGLFRQPKTLQEILQPVAIVPESMPANVLLAELTGKQRSVAIVVDEFGGTAGMITMEDLVEQVFGDIEDEYDEMEEEEEDMILQLQEDGSYLLGSRLSIEDLNEKLELNLPENEAYSTLGGLLLFQEERIPAKDEIIDLGEYRIRVMVAAENRVISVQLQKQPPEEIE